MCSLERLIITIKKRKLRCFKLTLIKKCLFLCLFKAGIQILSQTPTWMNSPQINEALIQRMSIHLLLDATESWSKSGHIIKGLGKEDMLGKVLCLYGIMFITVVCHHFHFCINQTEIIYFCTRSKVIKTTGLSRMM